MKRYQVGGAVRDRLLGAQSADRDWCVVGETPDSMRALGFLMVGKDFPVFLHPETGEQHALARRADGGDGGASIEEDLAARDFTINAMARDEDGRLIDPYGGEADLRAGVLRHVGPAFARDPLRVLRGARFAARWPWFTVAPETMAAFANLAATDALDALRPERVWGELERALGAERPRRFVETLRDAGALARVFPEIDRLFGVPQPAEHHPEIDAGAHTLMSLDVATTLTADPAIRFAALVHDLGKGTTPPQEWPSHRGHEERGVAVIGALADRLAAPNRFRDAGAWASRWHLVAHRAEGLRPGSFVKLFDGLDAFHHPERLEDFLVACEADARGRLGLEDRPYPQAAAWRRAFAAAAAVTARGLIEAGAKPGEGLGAALFQRRAEAVRAALRRSAPRPAPSA